MRRMLTSFVGLSLVAGAAAMAWAEGPVVPGGSAVPVQVVAGGRLLQPRVQAGRPAVRRYRSYSIDPGTTGAVEGPDSGPVITEPRGTTRPSSSGRSKPSYMRADSKARGRFHQ